MNYEKELAYDYQFFNGLAYNLCKDWNDAHDLTQSALLKVFNYLENHEITDYSHLRKTIILAIKQCFLDNVKRKHRIEPVEQSIEILDDIEQKAQLKEMICYIRKLPPRQQEIMLLLMTGESMQNIAKKLNLTRRQAFYYRLISINYLKQRIKLNL